MRKLNILMVDDQPAKLLTYESMLSELGEHLIKAHTAREALAHLLKADIAVVLMDVNMPEFDGFELAAMIRQHPRCQKTAIIFVSAVHLSDLDRVRGYDTGAVDYVSVPVVPAILRAKVSVFIDLYRKSEELEQLNRTLEERVSARTAELEASIFQLQQSENRLRVQSEALAEADRRKSEFLAMLSHELRNPLQPIRTAIEVLRQAKVSREQAEWARDIVDRQVRHLIRLVDDLLDASRITRGKLELRNEVVELTQIVTEAVEANRPLAGLKRHEVVVALPSESIHVDGDAVRLMQVFLNLLNNAVQYTPADGRIEVAVEAEGDDVAVRIKDNGTGIAEGDGERIFEMFYQGSNRSDEVHGGLGLGLALVRQLVDLHGGTVHGRSAGPDQGSEFCVRLPKVSEKTRYPMASASDDPYSRPPMNHRILVVDDNRDAAESLAMLLRLAGNTVEMAFDGAGAILASAKFRPDIVLMDLGMPMVDGYAAARAIRQDVRGGEIVLIAVTGWGGEANRRDSLEAGFDEHLVKPIAVAELLALLSSLHRTATQ